MEHIITTTLGRIFDTDTGLEIMSSKLWHSWLIYLGQILLSVWPRYDSESDLRIPTDRQRLHSRQVCLHNLCSNVCCNEVRLINVQVDSYSELGQGLFPCPEGSVVTLCVECSEPQHTPVSFSSVHLSVGISYFRYISHKLSTLSLTRQVTVEFRLLILMCFCLRGTLLQILRGTRWRSWLRHCTTSRKVAVSIPDGVIGIFH